MTTVEQLTSIAKKQIGNGGSKYRKWFYNRDTDYYGVNWCAVFISWLFAQVNGIDKYAAKTDGAGTIARNSDGKYGKWYEPNQITPKEGDIVMFRWGGSYTDKYHSDHVGYVYYAGSTYIYTIEGNTGSNNSDTSTVMYKQYSKTNSAINGYYRPNYNQQEESSMNFKNGDISDGVLAYKSLLMQAQLLGLITSKVDNTSGFGSGTKKATLEVQKKYKLEQDGIAGKNTITALRNAINKALTGLSIGSTMKKGDINLGVYAVKRSLQTAHAIGVIKSNCDNKNGFGSGTENCVKEVQKIADLKQSGVIDKGVINAINNLIEKRIEKK